MGKRSIPALMLAILLPLAGYFIVKYYSVDAVQMPRRYFLPDTVVVRQEKGKTIHDTVWHRVRNIQLVNQLGKHVDLDSLHGKILVIDFFFTRCPVICPGMARNMKKLQDAYAKNDGIVHFLSLSIDPEHDSVQNLRKFADRYYVNHDTWWFATGDKKDIYDFALNELKANVADVNVDTAFPHAEYFFLLDTSRVVRGFYNGFDSTKQALLARNISLLMLERNKNSPSILRSFIPILPLIFMGIAFVFLVMIWINTRRGKKFTQ